MSETISAEVPISIRWTQELVDDGSGGENFYVRLTPKIDRRVSRVKLKKLMTVIKRLKQEKTNEIKKAAKQGVQQGITQQQRKQDIRQEAAKETIRLSKLDEQNAELDKYSGFSSAYGSRALQKAFEADLASGRLSEKDVQFEKAEKEDEKEKEEIYYIK